jgi:hypothetical protein
MEILVGSTSIVDHTKKDESHWIDIEPGQPWRVRVASVGSDGRHGIGWAPAQVAWENGLGWHVGSGGVPLGTFTSGSQCGFLGEDT